jgi:ABC-type sugar transport system substrate-binding protein
MKQDNVRMGTEIVDDAISIAKGGKVDAKILIPGILIDKTNVDKYLTPQPAVNPADITIAYSGYATSNDFWNTLGKAAAAEAQAKGVKFIDLTTETQDASAQKQAIDTVITQKPSAIIIGSVDPNVFKDTIAKAKAAGIPILAVDTAIDDPYISALVQTDNLATAQVLGDYICKLLNGAKGTALVMAGSVAHQTGDARQKGVADKLEACGEKVIKEYSDWDENKAVQISTDTITANPDLNIIFAPWDPGAAAVASLVKQKGLTGKIMVFGVDGLPVMFKAIKAGDAVATMKQDNVRMGTEIVDDAISIVNGQSVEPKILIPGILIDKTNVDQYLTPQ